MEMEIDKQPETLIKTIKLEKMDVDDNADFNKEDINTAQPATLKNEEVTEDSKPAQTSLNDVKCSEDAISSADLKDKTSENAIKSIAENVIKSKAENVIESKAENAILTEASQPAGKKLNKRKVDSEKTISLTADEVKEYLLKKVGEYMDSPVNPLYNLLSRAKEVEEKGRENAEEYVKLYKALQLLERKHENFLRKIKILPKIIMCHASVSADLPIGKISHLEPLMKREVTITKVDDNLPQKTEPDPKEPESSKAKPETKPSNIECIDLTDDTEQIPASKERSATFMAMTTLKHPAPLPPRPFTSANIKNFPAKPRLKISAEDKGIVLQWDMPFPNVRPGYEPISSFDIFGYQEQKNSTINTLLWKKIGTVKAMSLPMACTLTQFVDGNKYHFSIRAVDAKGHCGNFSDPISIVYKQTNTSTPK